jgi:hypothetical protein
MFIGCGFTAIFLRGDEEESKGMKTSEGKHEDVGRTGEGKGKWESPGNVVQRSDRRQSS